MGSMDTCIRTAESLGFSPETITTLLIGYAPIQNKVLKKRNNQRGKESTQSISLRAAALGSGLGARMQGAGSPASPLQHLRQALPISCSYPVQCPVRRGPSLQLKPFNPIGSKSRDVRLRCTWLRNQQSTAQTSL